MQTKESGPKLKIPGRVYSLDESSSAKKCDNKIFIDRIGVDSFLHTLDFLLPYERFRLCGVCRDFNCVARKQSYFLTLPTHKFCMDYWQRNFNDLIIQLFTRPLTKSSLHDFFLHQTLIRLSIDSLSEEQRFMLKFFFVFQPMLYTMTKRIKSHFQSKYVPKRLRTDPLCRKIMRFEKQIRTVQGFYCTINSLPSAESGGTKHNKNLVNFVIDVIHNSVTKPDGCAMVMGSNEQSHDENNNIIADSNTNTNNKNEKKQLFSKPKARKNVSFNILLFSDCNLGNDGVIRICNALTARQKRFIGENSNEIKMLYFSHDKGIDDRAMKVLFECAANVLHMLERVVIQRTSITDNTCDIICDFLHKMVYYSPPCTLRGMHLQQLNIGKNPGITMEGLMRLDRAVTSIHNDIKGTNEASETFLNSVRIAVSPPEDASSAAMPMFSKWFEIVE